MLNNFNFTRVYLFYCIVITLLYFALTYLGSYSDMVLADVFFMVSLIIIISILEYFVVKKRILVFLTQKFTFSLFVFFNIYAVNLVFNEGLIKQTFYVELLLIILGLFLSYTVLSILNDYRKYQKIFLFILLVVTISLFFKPHFVQDTIIDEHLNNRGGFKSLPINFKKKPNVYIIGIDALIPKSLLVKHLDLNTTELHKILDKEFISYKNVFSGGARTIPSYLSMLSLTPEYWHALNDAYPYCKFCPSSLNRNNLVNGLTPSPLIMTFKANGYETTTTFEWPHFGENKGPYVDNYLLRTRQDGIRMSQRSICNLTSPRASLIGFFGYCKLRNKLSFIKDNAITEKLHYKGFDFNLAWDLQNIESISSKTTPQLYIAHILSTRHTSYDFNITNINEFNDFRDFYLKYSNLTAKLMNIVLENIKKNDSNAIVYVWGDHGPILSQHMSWDQRIDNKSNHKLVKSSKFFVQDRLGTYGGVYHNGSVCEKSSFQNNRTYNTPQHILKDILFCLATDESKKLNEDYFVNFIKDRSFAYQRRGENKVNLNDVVIYKDYLYE